MPKASKLLLFSGWLLGSCFLGCWLGRCLCSGFLSCGWLNTGFLSCGGQLALLAGNFVFMNQAFLGCLVELALGLAVCAGSWFLNKTLQCGAQAPLGFGVPYRCLAGLFNAFFCRLDDWHGCVTFPYPLEIIV